MKIISFITSFIIIFSFIGCSQTENIYFKETTKLLSLIVKEDSVGIKSFVTGNLEETKYLRFTMRHDIEKYNNLIAKFGIPTKYELKQYPVNDARLCDVIVKVGNDVDFGILIANFYRNSKPNRIFLFNFEFDTNTHGVIYGPENK